MSRIARFDFGGPPPTPSHPPIPNLNDPTLGIIHIGTDIVVHWIDSTSINRVSFNAIFGAVTTWNSTIRRDR